MAAVRGPDRRDFRRVAGRLQPVVNRRPDPASLDRWIAGPGMAGDQQDDALAGGDCPLEAAIDRAPCLVEIEAVQIEHHVGLDRARAKAPVPAGIERCAMQILPGTGRGTMRSMVEGRRVSGVFAAAPSTALRAVPLPVPGRSKP